MVKTRTQIGTIARRFTGELAGRGVRVEKLYLFGSYAVGHPTADSDIDLAVISSSFDRKGLVERQEILGEAVANVGAPIDAIGYGSREARGPSAFLKEIFRKGKSLRVSVRRSCPAIPRT
jgi:uncharacterized protein